QYQHTPPTLASLRDSTSIHPGLKAVILRGRDIFMNTQQFRGEYVFNSMNCKSCHLDGGRRAWAGPIWPAATTLPDYRNKNQQVNFLEERIAGCFAYSMNGRPPPYGSDTMLALVAYHRWLATGAPVYQGNIYGRGYRHLGTGIPPGTSRTRGASIYRDQCAACHGEDGGGLAHDEDSLIPALWGDNAYNWGSGMSRIFTSAAFIHLNMPFAQAGSLSPQDAWDLALFVNSHERPQDPRYDGSAVRTRQRYEDFHRHTLYGTEVNGRLLGKHDNTGAKPFLRPPVLRSRDFGS
ncbi:MAG: c-type cytochrome, partial [Chromatocurvus sp.]